jgi:hypothetical protein
MLFSVFGLQAVDASPSRQDQAPKAKYPLLRLGAVMSNEAIGIAPQITPRCVLGLIALWKY